MGPILILVKYECGQTTSENGTYFVSPSTTNRKVNSYLTGVGWKALPRFHESWWKFAFFCLQEVQIAQLFHLIFTQPGKCLLVEPHVMFCNLKRTKHLTWSSVFEMSSVLWDCGRICNLMVNRASDDICQIRLDFVTFNIAPPNNTGECLTDFFLVTGGSAVPQICGINDGQHLIYSITSDSGPSQLSMILDTTVTVAASRMWNIRVTQYSCSSRNLAPVGCLQYYTGASGEFKSFNYKSEVSATNDPNHLANQNYAVCIRVENGYCGIRYSQVTNDIYSFTVSGDSAQTNFMLASSEVKYGDTDCRNDYIIIPGGSDNGVNNEFSRDRHLIMSSYSKTCTFHQNYAFLDFAVMLWGLAPPLREPCALQRLDQLQRTANRSSLRWSQTRTSSTAMTQMIPPIADSDWFTIKDLVSRPTAKKEHAFSGWHLNGVNSLSTGAHPINHRVVKNIHIL